MKILIRSCFAWALSLWLAVGPAWAAVPQNIIYQGSLRRAGTPFTGNATLNFRITDAAGGPTYWTSGASVTAVTGSFFRYPLGSPNEAAFQLINWANITPYVEVTVDGVVMSPREPLNAVPYSIYAGSLPYVSPGAAGVQVSNNLFITGNLGVGTAAPAALLDVNGTARTGALTIAAGQTVSLGRAPVGASEAATKAYVDAQSGSGGGGVLASTNSWSAWQTHLNQVTFSTDVYFSAGQINVKGKRLTTVAGNLDASQLVNTVPTGSLNGAYGGVTAVGTLTAGTWQSAVIGTTYGGTGAILNPAAGAVAYSEASTLALTPVGASGQVLQSNGAAAPSWVSPSQSSMLSSTNTWSSWQTHLNQVTFSTDVYFSAGQLNVQGNRVTTVAGKLDAAQLANTVPSGSLVGAYGGVTGVGTLAAGTWQAGVIGTTYGGTGADLSAGAAGGVPYFSGLGVLGALGAGTAGYVLQSGGAAAPSWAAQSTLAAGTASSLALGSAGTLPYQSAANTTAMLAAGIPGQVLSSNGAAPPSWATAFAQANNLTGGVAGGMPYQSAPNTTGMVPAGIAGQIMMSNAAASPSWTSSFPTQFIFSGGFGSVAGPTTSLTVGAGGAGVDAVSMAFGDNSGWKYHLGTNAGGVFASRFTVVDTGNVGIGTVFPTSKLTVGAAMGGAALSTTLASNGGALGAVMGDELPLGSIGFTSANNSSLGVRAYRAAAGVDWTTTAIGLGMDVDDTVRAGANVWLHANGNVGIGATVPAEKLEIAGTDTGLFLNSLSSNLIRYNINGVAAPAVTARSPGTKLVLYPSISPTSVDYAFGINSSTLWYSVPQANSTYAHKFYGGITELMRIRGDGKVGIGLDPSYLLDVNGEITSRNATAFRLRQAAYGFMLYDDDANFYMLMTANGTPDATYNALRPFRVNNASGDVSLGSDRLYVQHGGSVGIGTTSPGSLLHLVGTPGVDGITFPDGTFMTGAGVGSAGSVVNTGSAVIQADSDANGSGTILLKTGANDRMIVENDGDIGIGTTSPIGKVHIVGTSQNTLSLDSPAYPELVLRVSGAIKAYDSIVTSAGGYFTGSVVNDWIFRNEGGASTKFGHGTTTDLTIKASGDIGIGTSSPGDKLEINGNLRFTGANPNITASSYLVIPNGIYVSGGTPYFANEIQARGGIANDTAATALTIAGGGVGGAQGGDTYFTGTGEVGIGTTSPAYKLDVAGSIHATSWLRTDGATGWYNDTYQGGWFMNDATWIRSYNSKDVYINTFLRADGGIASGNVATDGAGTIHATGAIRTESNLRVDGQLTCLGATAGACVPNGVMRLTPNLHLNAGDNSAVIINWDNGTTVATDQTFRIGNGAAADVFYVTANGDTYTNGKINIPGAQQLVLSDVDTTNNLKLQLWSGYGLGINGGTLFYAANGNHSWRDSGGTNERMLLTTGAGGGLTVKGTGSSSFAGRLGVFTAAPGAMLHVAASNGVPSAFIDTAGTSATDSQLAVKRSGQAQIGYNPWGDFPSALIVQSNVNGRFLWMSAGENVGATNARVRVSGTGLDFYAGGTSADNGNYAMTIDGTGMVGIGMTNPAYALDVTGDINTTGDIRKAGTAYTNPDYVFEDGYKMLSLKELKDFLEANKHLPGVASTAEVRKNGVKLFEGNRVLLEKLEEAYLYLLHLNGDVSQQKAAIDTLKAQNDSLQVRLEKLEGR